MFFETNGESKGEGTPGAQRPKNFLNFMQFFGRLGKAVGEGAPPPTRNPGSAPGNVRLGRASA